MPQDKDRSDPAIPILDYRRKRQLLLPDSIYIDQSDVLLPQNALANGEIYRGVHLPKGQPKVILRQLC